MRIGITGANGFIAWHMRVLLRIKGLEGVRLATRETFSEPAKLAEFVSDLDVIVHLAGINRGEDKVVEEGNCMLAEQVLQACENTRTIPAIVFANSIHMGRDNPYGRGKKKAAQKLMGWAEKKNTTCANLILPHTFGEFARPYYNSAVSTFCHQLSRAEIPQVTTDATIELIAVQDVVARCLAAALGKEHGMFRVYGTPTTVSMLLKRLQGFASSYFSDIIPDLRDPFDIRLFNTLRSYCYPAHYPKALKLHSDNRGTLFEAVKSHNTGQTFLSTTHPGITRGNHFHTRKVERFLVVSGQAQIALRKLFSQDVMCFQVDGEKPCYIDMPTYYTHNITNTGSSDLLTLFWSNEIFIPEDSDTYIEQVQIDA